MTGETRSDDGLGDREDDGETIENGTMVGEYAIDGVLGQGGMGKVYSATHPIIAKRAAVKVLHPTLSRNRESVERFVQEARSVNQIGHPNIVDIFAFGTLIDGRSYFVMEYLRGQSLRDRLHTGPPLRLAEAIAMLDTVAQALEAAHEAGIVHRDLKPDNIFLVELKGTAPQVKLLDFGIAKLLGNDAALTERTRTGNLMGTPAYMSPEQARGYAVDHRTDIYAFGCLAFELVTGRLPYPSDNAADMIAQHLYGEVPSARAHVSPELDALLVAMMAKDAAARPSLATAREVLRAQLARPVASVVTAPTRTVQAMATLPPRPSRSPALVIAIVGTLVVALGVTMFVLVRQSNAPVEPPPSPPPPAAEKHVTMPLDKPAPDVAPAPVPEKAPTPAPVIPKLADQPPPDGVEAKRPDMGEAIKQLDLRHNQRKGLRVGKRPPPIAPATPSPKPLDDDDAPMRP